MVAQRFNYRIQVYVTKAIADGLRVLVDNNAMSESAHIRTALLHYLRYHGLALPQPQQPALNNGHQPKELEHGH